jgi:xanthine/CO dehydrogenase XdhC/CoxF family maturation factor
MKVNQAMFIGLFGSRRRSALQLDRLMAFELAWSW